MPPKPRLPVDPNISVVCDGESIERVGQFTYLGSSIQLDGDISHEVRMRCAKATVNARKLTKFWISKAIPRKVTCKIYHACVYSVLLYCCETWPIKTRDIASNDASRYNT